MVERQRLSVRRKRSRENWRLRVWSAGLRYFGMTALVIATVALVGALFDALGPVRCDGRVMQVDDRCNVMSQGRTGAVGYDEMDHRQRRSSAAALSIGIPLLVLGGAALIADRRLADRLR